MKPHRFITSLCHQPVTDVHYIRQTSGNLLIRFVIRADENRQVNIRWHRNVKSISDGPSINVWQNLRRPDRTLSISRTENRRVETVRCRAVADDSQRHVFYVVFALQQTGCRPCILNCRQNERHQHGNDGYHDKQFEDRKPAAGTPIAMSHTDWPLTAIFTWFHHVSSRHPVRRCNFINVFSVVTSGTFLFSRIGDQPCGIHCANSDAVNRRIYHGKHGIHGKESQTHG